MNTLILDVCELQQSCYV